MNAVMDAFEVRIGFCSIFLLILFLLIIFIFLQSDEDDVLLVGKSINNNNPVAPSPTTTNRDVSKLVLNTYADRQSALSAFANAITLVVVVGINLNRDKWDVYFHNNSWPTTLRDGIYHVPLRLVDDERIPGGEHVYVNLAGNRLANSYDYRGFAAGVLRHGSARVENMLQQLARMLNSNEQFKMDHSFQLSWLTSNNTGAEVATSAKRNQVIPNHTPQKRLKWSIIASRMKIPRRWLCPNRAGHGASSHGFLVWRGNPGGTSPLRLRRTPSIRPKSLPTRLGRCHSQLSRHVVRAS